MALKGIHGDLFYLLFIFFFQSEVSLNSKTFGGGLDVAALTLIQSAFRGHLARCSFAIKRLLIFFTQNFEQLQPKYFLEYFCLCFSSGFAVPSPTENCPPALVPGRAGFTDSPRRKGKVGSHIYSLHSSAVGQNQ